MSHKHETCTLTQWGLCTEGRLTSECEDDHCMNEYCSDLGHCSCHCHDGKTCNCGYVWPVHPKVLQQSATEKGGNS